MQIVIILSYFLVIFLISVHVSKHNNNISEFVTAKSSLGVIVIIPMLLSELIAGSATVGLAASGYSVGISSVWSLWGMALGCILAVIFVTKFYRVMACKGKLTVGEAFGEYFDERTRIVMVFITVIVCLILFSLQPVAAAGIIAPLLKVDQRICTLVIGLFFIVTAVLGGIKGVAKVNFINSSIMYIGIGVSAFFAIRHAGGLNNIIQTLPKSYFSFSQPSVLTVIAWIAGGSINVPAGAVVSGAILTSKSVKTANRALIGTACLIIPFAVLVAMTGISAKAMGLNITENNVIFTITNQMSPILSGLASMAILAAVFDAHALLVLIGGTVTRDIYMIFVNKDVTEDKQAFISKVFVVIFGIIGILMGFMPGGLIGKFLGAFQIRASAGLIIMLAMMNKRIDNNVSFWGILIGGGISVIWFFAGNPFGIEPIWPSLIVTSIIVVGFLLFGKKEEYAGHANFKKDLEKYKNIL